MVDSAKRKRDTLTHEEDLRNVARKLFSQQTAAANHRPSIAGSGNNSKSIPARKPAVPRFAIKADPRPSSLQPLKTVTNTLRVPVNSKAVDSRVRTGRPVGTFAKPAATRQVRPSGLNKAAPAAKAVCPETLSHLRQLEAAEVARKEAEQATATLQAKVDLLLSDLASKDDRHQAELQELRCTLAAKDASLQQKDAVLAQRDLSITELTIQRKERDARIVELEKLVADGDWMRKKLHNAIQELKGNIRVIARVRGNCADVSSFSFPDKVDHRAIELLGPATTNYAGDEKNKTFQFNFDKVFEPNACQSEVFEEISQVVQSALDGYKVTVFAYGQTGSGKTFTMEGPVNGNEMNAGMIPRAVAQIFEEGKRLQPQGWEFLLEATFVEIYLEEVRDLLGDTGGYERRAGVNANGVTTYERNSPKHEIHHGPDGSTTISNVTTVPVTQPSDVFRLLQIAARNRSTASTKMNERSSRSHSVFTLRITGHNKGTDQKSCGVLNLIDLAGSERLNASGVAGDRLKETQNINRSLACLGDVIAALASKKAHIPYRNSKLTYLLQNCLGGDGKTLMFVNISPEAQHLQESICSLRFASKVNSCEIGTAKRKVQ